MADDDRNDMGPTTGLAPHLSIGGDGASAASAFYQRAFAATETFRMPSDDGKRLMHCSLLVNGSVLMMADYFPEYGYAEQTPAGFTLHLAVDDADAWFKRAVDAGCTPTMELADQFWGDRYGQVKDPFGFTWAIGSPIKKD